MVQLGVNILYYCIYQTIVQLYLLTSCSDFFFFLFDLPGFSFNLFVQHSQSDLPPLRPLCGEVPGRDSNLGRADLVAGTLTTRPPHLPLYTTTPPNRSPHLLIFTGSLRPDELKIV